MSLKEIREAHNDANKYACAKHPEVRLTNYRIGIGRRLISAFCSECDGEPENYIRRSSETEKYMTGQPQSAAVVSRLSRKHGEMTLTTELELKKPTDAQIKETGKEFASLVMGFGEQISDGDLILAAQLNQVGFQPFHFNVIHGQLYLNYKGRTFWTSRALGAADGGKSHRPMSPEEREAYGLEADEVGFVATVYKLNPAAPDGRISFENFGRAGGSRDAKQAVAKVNKAEVALKRAYARAMELAAPLGVDMSTYIDLPNGGEVLDASGELIDVPPYALEEPTPAEPKLEPKLNTDLETNLETDLETDLGPVSPEELRPELDLRAEPEPELKPRKRISAQMAQEVVDRINGFGITNIDVFEFEEESGREAVMKMLRAGHDPEVIAEAVRDSCENTEELPW